MKKIIAAAITAAFVTPAMADVSVSGSLAQYLIDSEEATTPDTAARMGGENSISISASTEANNGITVSGSFNIAGGNDIAADGGDHIKISHPSAGSLILGNTSSAVDAIDDKTEILELIDPLTGTYDSAVRYTLPKLVDGLSVHLSYTPEDGANATGAALTVSDLAVGSENDGESTLDEQSIGLAYQAGPVRIAYGQGDEGGDNEDTFYGLQFKSSGIMVAYESNESKDASDAITDTTSIALSYTMGDATIKYLATDEEAAGTQNHDITAYGLHYNLGGGATAVLESGSDDAGDELDYTAFGVKYKF